MILLEDDLPRPFPIGQVSSKGNLPDEKIYLSQTIGRDLGPFSSPAELITCSRAILTDTTNTTSLAAHLPRFVFAAQLYIIKFWL